ncbi:MAG TPA: MFS transporter [Gemmataceae bacterium]|jgi:MHS family proline/betaine transporter-like MFS transporter
MSQHFPESSAQHSSRTRTVVAGAIGNLLEWYDFGLFGFFAPVIARQIMPVGDRLATLLETFGVFAAGFLMRPLGGVIFGYVGDRWGRKRALELSVLLMAVATTLIGLLPPHSSIGLAAPLLLTLMRLLQGLSVGGEYVGSMSFLSEHAAPARRAFFGSWSSFSVVLGSLLGSAMAALLTGLLSEAQLLSWGWRLPFLGGVLIGVAGLWLRLGIEESPSFLQIQKTDNLAANPIAEALRKNLSPIAITLGLAGVLSVGFYLPFVWLPTWLSQINRPLLDEGRALIANTIALAALLALTPLAAWSSDRVGRRPMILGTALGYALLSYPLFLLMSAGTFAGALLGGLVFAACNSLFSGCMAATLVELFPTRTRYSGMAIAYNVGMALLGGTAPLAATGLIRLTGDVLAPAYYLIGAGAVTGVACLFVPPRHGQPLD